MSQIDSCWRGPKRLVHFIPLSATRTGVKTSTDFEGMILKGALILLVVSPNCLSYKVLIKKQTAQFL